MSTDARLLWNAPPFPVRQPRAAEPLWSMDKDGHRIDAQLRGHGEYGWELQLLRDGEFYAGQRCHLRQDAVALGEVMRRDYESQGWRLSCARCVDTGGPV